MICLRASLRIGVLFSAIHLLTSCALEGSRAVGVTAGASAPEVLVNEVIDAFRARFAVTVEMVETAVENVEFKVPRILREPV